MLKGFKRSKRGYFRELAKASGSITINGAVTSASPVAFGSGILLPANSITDGTRFRIRFALNLNPAATAGAKTFSIRFGDELSMTNVVNIYYTTLAVTAQSWSGIVECAIRGTNVVRDMTATSTGTGNVANGTSSTTGPDWTANKRIWFACVDLPASESMILEDYCVEILQ